MNKLRTVAVLAGLSTSLHAQVLLSENFETYSSGNVPTATSVNQNGTDRIIQVVSGATNTAGGGAGNGLRFFDNGGAAALLEYNIVGSAGAQISFAHISFDIAWSGGSGADQLIFSVGNYSATSGTGSSLNAAASRMASLQFTEGGTARGAGGANGTFAALPGSAGTANSFDIFINDHNTNAVSMLAPDGSTLNLAADSFAIYLNNTSYYTGTLANSGTIAATSAGIGRIGFYSGTTSAGPDFVIDNLIVSATIPAAVPEPSAAAALAGLGILGFAATRRRRA